MARNPQSPSDDAESVAEGARGRAENVRRDLREAQETAGDDLAELRRDLAKLTETVSNLVSNQAGHARSTVTDAAAGIYDSGAEALRYAEDQARTARDDIVRTIERNPMTAVAAALGVGMILGMMNRGR